MMTVTIAQIQQTAKGGFARVDAAGEWKTGGKGLGGRVVAWITNIVSHSKVVKENRAAIDHFVRAIGSDTRYNDSFSMVAEQKLRHLSGAGKPLRERKITQVLSELEDLRVSHDKMNHTTAEWFSTTDSNATLSTPRHYKHSSFIDALYQAAQERDLPHEYVELYKGCMNKAAADIKQEILAIGDNGKKLVPSSEARNIAEKRTREMTDQLVTLDNILRASDLGKETQYSLKQGLMYEPDISKEIIFSFIHGRRTNELAYESGKLPQMLYQTAKAAGIGKLAGSLTLQAGVDSGMIIRVTDRLKTDFPDAIVTKAEILSMLNDEVSSYVATRKNLMDYVDTCGLTGKARAEMRKMIAQDPSIKKTEHINAIIAAAPSYGSFCQSISVGGTEEMAAAYVRHQHSFDQAIESLMHSGMTVDETASLRTQALSLWVAQQKDKRQSDPNQVDNIQHNMELAYDNLTGHSGDLWVDSTVWVAEQHRRVDSKVDGIARTIQDLRHAMAAEIGGYLGIEPADDYDAIPTREGIAENIGGEADVSDNVYCMFRELGVKVPLPELMGRSKAEAFDNSFSERFVGAINDELQTTGDWKHGIDSTTYRDMNRANYFTGKPGTPEDSLTAARIGDGEEAALGIFNKLFDDNHDEAGKQMVSKVTHQGIFAAIDKGCLQGYGPFSQAIVRTQSNNESDISYRIWLEPGGMGYRVQASLFAPVQAIMDPVDGAIRLANRETSKLAFEATFRISRESIDSGNPRAELVTPPTYEYRIDPEQEKAKLPDGEG